MSDRLLEIESGLRSELAVTSVAEIPDSPFSSYAEIQELYQAHRLSISIAYDPGAMDLFASRFQLIFHYILAWIPGAVVVADIATAIATSHYLILLGVPLALAGFLLTTPFITRFFIMRFVSFGALLAFIYYCWHQAVVPAFLTGSYILSFLSAYFVRIQSYYVTLNTLLLSELVFVWLYTKKLLLLTRRS